MKEIIVVTLFLLVVMIRLFRNLSRPIASDKKQEFDGIIEELYENHRYKNYLRHRGNGSFSIEMQDRRISCVKSFDTYLVTLINGDAVVPVNNVEVRRKKDLIFLLDSITK